MSIFTQELTDRLQSLHDSVASLGPGTALLRNKTGYVAEAREYENGGTFADLVQDLKDCVGPQNALSVEQLFRRWGVLKPQYELLIAFATDFGSVMGFIVLEYERCRPGKWHVRLVGNRRGSLEYSDFLLGAALLGLRLHRPRPHRHLTATLVNGYADMDQFVMYYRSGFFVDPGLSGELRHASCGSAPPAVPMMAYLEYLRPENLARIAIYEEDAVGDRNETVDDALYHTMKHRSLLVLELLNVPRVDDARAVLADVVRVATEINTEKDYVNKARIQPLLDAYAALYDDLFSNYRTAKLGRSVAAVRQRRRLIDVQFRPRQTSEETDEFYAKRLRTPQLRTEWQRMCQTLGSLHEAELEEMARELGIDVEALKRNVAVPRRQNVARRDEPRVYETVRVELKRALCRALAEDYARHLEQESKTIAQTCSFPIGIGSTEGLTANNIVRDYAGGCYTVEDLEGMLEYNMIDMPGIVAFSRAHPYVTTADGRRLTSINEAIAYLRANVGDHPKYPIALSLWFQRPLGRVRMGSSTTLRLGGTNQARSGVLQ